MRFDCFLAVCGIATVASVTGAGAVSLDFEGLRAGQGTITGTETPGVTISLSGTGSGALGVYDSSCRSNCTGGDSDLATGNSITAAPINAAQNTPAEDFILISSSGSGANFGDLVGSPLFTFTFDLPTFVNSFVLIDIDEVATQVGVTFNFADGVTPSSMFDGTAATTVFNLGANNSHSTFDIATIALTDANLLLPVSSLEIQFNSISGGIGAVSATPVPVPAALPLLASGFGLLGWMSRRRRLAA